MKNEGLANPVPTRVAGKTVPSDYRQGLIRKEVKKPFRRKFKGYKDLKILLMWNHA